MDVHVKIENGKVRNSVIFPLLREERVRVRRTLRRVSTPTEIILWGKIRSRQIKGLKFRRQYPIGKYVVDFYCPEKNLVIEIDGDIHDLEEVRQRDTNREKYLKDLGLQLIHFTTHEIRQNLDGVLERIYSI